jgi:Ca-activated chloride channel family protein
MRSTAVVALIAAAAAALPAEQRFRSGVEMVAVDVLVTDGRTPVGGLTAANFELRDQGVLQTIESVAAEVLPLDLILVLDVSESVTGRRLEHLKHAATSILGNLRPPDRVALLPFSHELQRPTSLTADHDGIRRTIQGLIAGGSTALRDAVATGLTLRQPGHTRALLVLFSDGVDTASFLGEARVIEAATRADIVIYGVGLRTPADGVRLHVSPLAEVTADETFLRSVAVATGGRIELADGDDDIARAFERVLAEFRARYVLWFTPTGVEKGGWHRLDVRLKNRRGVVAARRGYFAR